MKQFLALITLFCLLYACDNQPAGTDAGKPADSLAHQSTDSNSAPAPTGTPDSAQEGEVIHEPVVRPGDTTASVIPPDESDSIKFSLIDDAFTAKGHLNIDADFIQLYYGDKAVAAARKRKDAEITIMDGDTTYSVPNDLYIVNENKRKRLLEVADNASFWVVAHGDGEMKLLKTTANALLNRHTPDRIYILHLNKQQVVTSIREQYLP